MRKTHPKRVTPSTGRAPRRRPIGLAALRGFESAARQLSFTLAAGELNLTQSSISRQVAALERQVGKPLFVRATRSLQLTAAGERLYTATRAALAGIDRTVEEIRGRDGTPRVTITTYPSFASLWLVPRLAEFQRAHPEIEIRIDASDRMLDLAAAGVDIALRRCRPEAAPPGSWPLLQEEATPALAPALLERSGVTLAQPSDLLRLPLLEIDDDLAISVYASWRRWFDFAQVEQVTPTGRLFFSFVDQSVQAAIRGQGVVLARTPFLDDLLAGGSLIVPFPRLRMSTGLSYFLVENAETRERPAVAAFRDWALEQFRRGPQRLT
jgi:LysR family glycine cleavage system transcriptional activator